MKKNRIFSALIAGTVCIFPILLSAQADSLHTEVTLSAKVSQNEVPFNRTLDYIITLAWSGNLNDIEMGDVEEPVLSNFDILGTAASNKTIVTASGPQAVKQIIFTLKPKTLGMGYVEPVAVTYHDTKSDSDYHLISMRIGVKVEAPVTEPGQHNMHWFFFISGALLFILAVGAGYWIFNSRKKKEIPEEVQPMIEERYLAELKQTIDLKAPDRRQTFTALSKLFRKYLSEKYAISGLEATTSELIGQLRNELDESQITACEALFAKADVVKFSGQNAEQSELERAYTTVENVLEGNLKSQKAKEVDS